MIYAQLSKSGLQGTKKAEQNLDMYQIINEIGGILSNSNNCKETFADMKNVKSIKKVALDGDLLDRYQVKSVIGNSNLSILSYELSDEDDQVSMEEEGTTYLYIEFDQGKLSKKGTIKKKVKMQFYFNDDDEVETCYSIGYGKSEAVVELFSGEGSEEDQKFCNRIGKLRFNEETNMLQICANEMVWYNVLMTCVPGTSVQCPSDETLIKTCNNLGIWNMPPNTVCPDW